MSGFEHASVLVDEVLEHLSPRNDGTYVDCTLGGGGHSAAILKASQAQIIGIDRDPTALQAAETRLAEFAPRARMVHGEFGDVASVLADLGIDQVDGFVADLGVSSPQLDHADRGFSFSKEGPLDMRMDPSRGQTALELMHTVDVDALADLIFEFGEERHSRKIARLIKEAIRQDQLRTTSELAAVVAKGIPPAEQRKSKIHPATRTFQALRIAVNRELDQLDSFLAGFPSLLKPGGRCVVISFHSLEDRLVKNRFRDLSWTSSLPPHLAQQAGERVLAVCEPVTRKAVFASDAETARNPRARSARLRACERTGAPNLPSHR
ncbi:MAG: S-adenosyl-methyltransferase MraW [Myxococcales bacterium]|nr:S-adenosyl-methyltransferase MraW [Myxococcales bacterium]